jgi:hypothetical protein
MKQTNRSNRSKSATRIAVLGLTALAATSTHATVGYFDYGYGVQAKGIGGAGVAFPQDALAPASNPAGAAFLDNRFDAGLTYFRPDRYASLGTTEYNGNGNQNFYVPEIGYKHSTFHQSGLRPRRLRQWRHEHRLHNACLLAPHLPAWISIRFSSRPLSPTN